MNTIQKLVADVRNKLTPFINLAYMVNDIKDKEIFETPIGKIILSDAKKCKELTPIVKEILENINIESDSKLEEKKLPYTVKMIENNYQIIYKDNIVLDNLTADNANFICDKLNDAYRNGLIYNK